MTRHDSSTVRDDETGPNEATIYTEVVEWPGLPQGVCALYRGPSQDGAIDFLKRPCPSAAELPTSLAALGVDAKSVALTIDAVKNWRSYPASSLVVPQQSLVIDDIEIAAISRRAPTTKSRRIINLCSDAFVEVDGDNVEFLYAECSVGLTTEGIPELALKPRFSRQRAIEVATAKADSLATYPKNLFQAQRDGGKAYDVMFNHADLSSCFIHVFVVAPIDGEPEVETNGWSGDCPSP